MKKIIFLTLVILTFSSIAYGYSSGFEYMLNTLEIPLTNVNGYWINEEIYNQYNLLVYGSPLTVIKNQRWKETNDGNWQYNGGAWNGVGTRGEYWILGETYAGKEVHNEVFPDDYNSDISPLDWNYIEIKDAEESWIDVSKYQTEKQKEYMLTQKLIRNNVTYDLTAKDIGTNKARAESFATWKTKGSIYTKKKDENGIYWGATFNVPPMAADATLSASLNFDNGLKYSIARNEESIDIAISYGANIENISEFVSKEDIKSIKAEILINDERVEMISKSQDIEVSKEYILRINKSAYENQSSIEISVKCNAMAETYFKADMPMYDSKEEILIIHIESEENNMEVDSINRRFESGDMPKIESVEIKRVSTNKSGKTIYEDLNVANKTNSKFICAGQVIYVRVKTLNNTESVTLEIEGDKSITALDDLTKKFEWQEPKERRVKTRFKSLKELENKYKMPLKLALEEDTGNGIRYFSTIYVIPYETKQTLNSWETLREEGKNAFEIKKDELFTRITMPYEIVIKAQSEIGITTKRSKLDVFEAWNKIYNRDLSKYIK